MTPVSGAASASKIAPIVKINSSNVAGDIIPYSLPVRWANGMRPPLLRNSLGI
jgi:hypothetical protein